MKFDLNSLVGQQLFATGLDELIPKDNQIRKISDKLDWGELTMIAKEAYSSDWYQEAPNPRIMIGLFVYSCLSDETYRKIESDFSFNLLCQYVCGFKTVEPRFIDHTTLIEFEKRLGLENAAKISEMIEKASIKKQPPRSKGSHSFDTSVSESNITFPTDTKLMESVRFFLADVISTYQKEVGQHHRFYPRKAREEYVNFSKKRKHSKKAIRVMKGKQLRHLRRNIPQAEQVVEALSQIADTKQRKKLVKKLKTKLNVAKQIFTQQKELLEGKKIKDRIVSFHRPSVRPIFKGKAGKTTCFGPKISASVCGSAIILGKIDFDNYHDGHALKETVEITKNRGHPLKEVIADKGCSGNKRYLKQNNIKNGIEERGKRSTPKEIPKKRFVRERNKMEGAFGTLQNVFGLSKMRAKSDFGDLLKIIKACTGFNLKYAFC